MVIQRIETPNRLTLVARGSIHRVTFSGIHGCGTHGCAPDTTDSLLLFTLPLGSDISCPRTYGSINTVPKDDPPHRRGPGNSEPPPALPYAAKIQALSKIFNLVTSYPKGDARKVGTLTLSSIDSFNCNRSRLQPTPVKDVRSRVASVDDPVRRGQRQIGQVKLKIAMQLDDWSFQQLTTDPRSCRRWNTAAGTTSVWSSCLRDHF